MKLTRLWLSITAALIFGVISAFLLCPPSFFHCKWTGRGIWGSRANIYTAVVSKDGKVALAIKENGKLQIRVKKPGSGWVTLTHGLLDADPAWDPTSTRIAYVSLLKGRKFALRVVNVNDGSETTLLEQDEISQPQWTLDGKRVIFLDNKLRRWRMSLCSIDVATKEMKTLTACPDNNRPQTWQMMPDGDKIVYIDTGSVWIASMSTGEIKKLPTKFTRPIMLSVSPNGKLLFVGTVESTWSKTAFAVDLATGQKSILTQGGVRSGRWSPTNDAIVIANMDSLVLLKQRSASPIDFKGYAGMKGTVVAWYSPNEIVSIRPDMRSPRELHAVDIRTGESKVLYP